MILFTTIVNALGAGLTAMINNAGVCIELIAACCIAIILALNIKGGPEVFFSFGAFGGEVGGSFLGAFLVASFGIGGAILVFAVMAAPNLADPQIGSSSGGLQYIVEQVTWGPLGKVFLACIVVAVAVCALAVHAAAIRLIFAIARDNALPFGE